MFSESIVFKTAGAIEEEFRLNTYQSFEISQLVKYNQALNDILLNLNNDSTLNSRVKLYRDHREKRSAVRVPGCDGLWSRCSR